MRAVFTSITIKMGFQMHQDNQLWRNTCFPYQVNVLVFLINLMPYILSAVQYIFFCSIKIVLEYDYTMGVCVVWVYGCKCTGVQVYGCTGVQCVWVYGCVRYYSDEPS
jgi:hypothetical protein